MLTASKRATLDLLALLGKQGWKLVDQDGKEALGFRVEEVISDFMLMEQKASEDNYECPEAHAEDLEDDLKDAIRSAVKLLEAAL